MPYAGYTEADVDMAPIEIADFESQGVTLTPASDVDFDARAQAILAGNAAPVLELKPYLAIVRNGNARTVVAYAIQWETTLRNGTSEFQYTQFKFPDAVAGTGNGLALLEGREIRTGEERLAGMGFEAWPPEYASTYRDYGLAAVTHLGVAASLRVALDAVVFDDGAMLGRDRSRLAEHFIEFVHAKQSLYREIVVGLETGDGLDAVVAPVRGALARRQVGPPDRMEDYRRQAASEILKFHNRVALEVFRRTLRREPFTIRRLSER